MKSKSSLLLLPLAFLFFQCASGRMAKKNEETIRLWFEEGWNHNRNEELIPRVFHPDWNDGNPLRPDQIEGLEGMRQLVQYYRKAFPDAKFAITHLFCDATHAAIRYEVSATHHGDAFGIPATGKLFTSTGIVIYEMEDGKIKRSWQELDLMGIIGQLKN